MQHIGVIGTGPEWETTWQPAFVAHKRLRPALLYDPVAITGERLSEQLEVPLSTGIRNLLDSPSLKGVVILNAGWFQQRLIKEAANRKLPVFISQSSLNFERLADLPQETGEQSLVQPDCRRRYTPATIRIRELSATRTGPIEHVGMKFSSPTLTASGLSEVIDWCRYVMQSAVTSLTPSSDGTSFRMKFRRLKDGEPLTGLITWKQANPTGPAPREEPFAAELKGQAGTLTISDSHRVRWMTDNDAETEELLEDRSSATMQIDLFSRRLAGGLVPIATLDDVRSSITLAQQALRGASSGQDSGF